MLAVPISMGTPNWRHFLGTHFIISDDVFFSLHSKKKSNRILFSSQSHSPALQRPSPGEYNAVGWHGNRFKRARAEIMARVTIIRFTNHWRGTYHRCYRQICTPNAISLELLTWVIVYLISLLTITSFPFVAIQYRFFLFVYTFNHIVCIFALTFWLFRFGSQYPPPRPLFHTSIDWLCEMRIMIMSRHCQLISEFVLLKTSLFFSFHLNWNADWL